MTLARCAVHTMTLKPWSLAQTCAALAAAGVPAVTVWRQHLPDGNATAAARIVADHGLIVPALCRGGFFPAADAAGRQAAIDDNRRALDEAAALGASQVVLVCGAVPGIPLAEARRMIADGIAACVPHARSLGVRLAIEPLHPCYAGDRSAVNTMAQARAICQQFRDQAPPHPAAPGASAAKLVGIAVDVYHVWWDDAVEAEIAAAGAGGWLHAFHVCDWKAMPADLLNDRGIMGEGVIAIPHLRRCAEAAGFAGYHEIEIFSAARWAGDQQRFLDDCLAAYRTRV